jgi:hypothetical protein
MKEGPPKIETLGDKESLEKGANVQIQLKFIRHGERTPDTMQLTDYGREVTRERAGESELSSDDFNAVKALGSNMDPNPETGMGRSLETADIYAQEIAGEEAFQTRPRVLVNTDKLISPAPFDWNVFYKSQLPENFNKLSNEEKAKASRAAQGKTFNHLLSMNTPEAEKYKKEMAGSFAKFIDKYIRMPEKLKSGSRVLIPAGTHGGMMEHLLYQALVMKDTEGKETTGLESIDDIGGGFDPSEAYNVFVETDEKGNLKALKVTFDNLNRSQGEMHLNLGKIQELKKFYEELHKIEIMEKPPNANFSPEGDREKMSKYHAAQLKYLEDVTSREGGGEIVYKETINGIFFVGIQDHLVDGEKIDFLCLTDTMATDEDIEKGEAVDIPRFALGVKFWNRCPREKFSKRAREIAEAVEKVQERSKTAESIVKKVLGKMQKKRSEGNGKKI